MEDNGGNFVKLEILGITYNQIESGVYAVILKEVDGERRLPIVIGYPEAQAIECKLQEIVTPRPLTHDLFLSLFEAFNMSIEKVVIRRIPSGVFVADIHCVNDIGLKAVIDARSSDAIALALRGNAPVYTTEEVMREAGFEQERSNVKNEESPAHDVRIKQVRPRRKKTSGKSIEELTAMMEQAAEAENYEEAARIKLEIEKRKKRD